MGKKSLTIKKFGKFIIVGGVGAVLQIGITRLLTESLNIDYSVSQGVSICLVTIVNFTLNNKWTFKRE